MLAIAPSRVTGPEECGPMSDTSSTSAPSPEAPRIVVGSSVYVRTRARQSKKRSPLRRHGLRIDEQVGYPPSIARLIINHEPPAWDVAVRIPGTPTKVPEHRRVVQAEDVVE